MLEMGIDVGDFFIVLFCFVLFVQVNYLQCIGCVGCKDGNVLNIIVVEGNLYDQFFFEELLEMMQGQVQVSGVFFNVMVIFECQLVVFCMDNWVKIGVLEFVICKNVKQMLDELEFGCKLGFLYNLLRYIEQYYVEIVV